MAASDFPPMRRLLAWGFSDFADYTTGERVRPSGKTLAAYCGVSERTVERHRPSLVADGWLVVTREEVPGKHPRTYRLEIPAGHKATDTLSRGTDTESEPTDTLSRGTDSVSQPTDTLSVGVPTESGYRSTQDLATDLPTYLPNDLASDLANGYGEEVNEEDDEGSRVIGTGYGGRRTVPKFSRHPEG